MPVFKLILSKTYYNKGFFNVPVAFERFVRPDNGPVEILLGSKGMPNVGRVDRRANSNETPRVHGNKELRDWFHSNHSSERCR